MLKMKKLKNPFLATMAEEYHCFGCAPHNEIGLKLEFYDVGDRIIANWKPRKLLQGYPDVVHGGIQSTLLDEIGGWTVYVKCNTAGVTKRMEVDYLCPVRISNGEVKLEAIVVERTEKEAVLVATLFDGEGRKCTEAKVTYYLYPPAIAKSRLHFPGSAAFYE